MEKAMWSANGVGYEMYCRYHSVRMAVERRRKQNDMKCRRMVAEFDRLVHFNNELKP